MAIQKREVQFAKEVDDVCVLLVGIVKDLKAKKPAGEVVSGAVPKLIEAISGIDQLGAEQLANRAVFLETIMYRVGELADSLLPGQVVPVVGPAAL